MSSIRVFTVFIHHKTHLRLEVGLVSLLSAKFSGEKAENAQTIHKLLDIFHDTV